MNSIIITDLTFGDAGKGTVTDFLTSKYKFDLIIRYNGGHQSAHNVLVGDKHHTFSQYGSGTFNEVPTHLGPNFIFCPRSTRKEYDELASMGVDIPTLSVDPKCLVTTYYHVLMNRIKETFRRGKNSHHGSCGVGIGETRSYWLNHGNDAIFASDLKKYDNDLPDKLELLRQRMMLEVNQYQNEHTGLLIDMLYLLSPYEEEKELRSSNKLFFTENFQYFNRSSILFEGSQGLLLDEYMGFHPHTTWSTTTSLHAVNMCKELGIENPYKLGIIRSHMSRHGNGPLPTEDKSLKIDDPYNKPGRYQDGMRYGRFDCGLFDYAINCDPQDGIFITHCDNDFGISGFNRKYTLENIFKLEYPKKIKNEFKNDLNDVKVFDYLQMGGVNIVGTSFGPDRKSKVLFEDICNNGHSI